MFTIDKYNNIKLTRGDSASIEVKVYDANNEARILKDTDVLNLTVKKTPDDIALLSKTAVEGSLLSCPQILVA